MNSKFILKAFLLILITFVIISSKSYSQSNFEGKIKMKIVSDGETHYMDYYAKDQKYRIEMEGMENQGATIWDPQNKKMLVIMPSQKMYMERSLDFTPKEEKSGKWKDQLKNVKFTDSTKTIHGYECKQAIYNSDDGTVTIWYTSGLGSFFSPGKSPMGGGDLGDVPEEIKEIMKNGFFPMLNIIRDEDGEETSRMEVDEVQKMSLNDNLFKAPANYKKFEMPNLPNLKDLMKGKN